jgi:NAD(P)-dependent dehydrogenase (short-subunit alcohol dehydrogenase family)
MDINNQVAIVTGGASGLGAETARILTNIGASVAIFDRNRSAGEALASELSGQYYDVDVTSESQVEQAIKVCTEQMGHPRVLINCAGIARNCEILDDEMKPHPLSDFIDQITVNLIGAFNCMRLFAAQAAKAPPLDEGERGVIINVGSISGSDCPSHQTAYGASKAGVMGMTLGAARSLSKWGIRVVTISPGLFKTPMLSAASVSIDALTEATKRGVPYPPRMGEPTEFGELVAAICRIRYINGEVIRLDGAMRTSHFNVPRGND